MVYFILISKACHISYKKGNSQLIKLINLFVEVLSTLQKKLSQSLQRQLQSYLFTYSAYLLKFIF